MGKLVIIEGVDCTGKTSFANMLYARQTAPAGLLHAGPPVSANPVAEYVLPLLPAVDGWTFVCDRWHLGELVWPIIFDREPMFKLGGLKNIEERLRNITSDITCIYMERELQDILREHEQHSDRIYDLVSSSSIIHALELYEDAIEASTFGWRRMTLPEAFNDIIMVAS